MRVLSIITAILLVAGVLYAKEVTVQIKVSGMTCDACAISVQKSLELVKGVRHTEVSAEKGLAAVTYDDSQTNEQRLREAIDKIGFKAEATKERK